MANYTRIILRHDTAANWTTVNPILSDGEIGVEIDTLKIKVGDGIKTWNQLGYSNTKINGATINENGELIISYEDNTTVNTGRVKGTSVSQQLIDYGTSNSPSTRPTSWSQTIPVVADGEYLWTRTTTKYDDPSIEDTYSYTYAKQGLPGPKGDTGAQGIQGIQGLQGPKGDDGDAAIQYYIHL